MKTDLLVPMTIDSALIESAKKVLLDGENLADFFDESIRYKVARRLQCRKFIA